MFILNITFDKVLVYLLFIKMDERSAIKCYFDKGFDEKTIIKKLKDLKITRVKIYRTVKRLRETGSIADRPRSGRPRSVRTQQLVNKIKCRLWRNPQQSVRKMALRLKTSQRTVRRVVREDLGLTPYKKRRVQGLSQLQIEKRLQRCKELLTRFAGKKIDELVFSDEKIFTVEEKLNHQNTRIYSVSFEDIPEEMRTVQRFQYENKIMVWCGLSKSDKFEMVFVEPGVKINANYYQRHVLMNVVKPQGEKIYDGGYWCFQQDSAPAHKAKICQNWCRNHLPDFITSDEWPPSSPDLNPLDYSIWGILEAKVNSSRHKSIDSLKTKLLREWAALSMDIVRKAIDSWPMRLRAVIQKRGGRFE